MKTINLDKFKAFEAKVDFAKLIDKYGKKAVNKLEIESPKSGRAGRETPYSKGWTVMVYKIYHGNVAVVWNKTNWQLTHLLENGHLITNNSKTKNGIAWVAPIKHIRPAFDVLKPQYIREAQKVKVKFKLK